MCLINVFCISSGIFYLVHIVIDYSNAFDTNDHHLLLRKRRQLLWPNNTILQFNAGIGTPSPAKMININWALQANFQLPWNRSQIPFDILEADTTYTGLSRRKREVDANSNVKEEQGDYKNDAKLYHFYKYIEEVLNGFGHNGPSCVLQTLCRLGSEPLHSDAEDDLLHEVASFVLNPLNDMDLGLTEKDEHYRYIEAFSRGEKGQDCFEIYRDCTTPVIDMFTRLHDTDEN